VQPLLEFKGSSRVYAIKRELGRGAFAPVYLVDSRDLNSDEADDDAAVAQPKSGNSYDNNKRSSLEAIKTEDPPSAWEFYIVRLLGNRLGPMSRTMQSIIRAHECHVFADECYLVLEYRNQGTLLDLVNSTKDENRKAGKADGGLDEVLAMFFSAELLRTLEECHGVGVLHGDLKADNCLVRFEGSELLEPYQRDGSLGWQAKGMTLIDFGRGIDARAFRPEVKFIADWDACAQDCAEVRECRPWTWQIDYFGAAGVIHSLLFGRYIETVQVAGAGAGAGTDGGIGAKKEWRLKESFKRYWAQAVWGAVFGLLLNPALVAGGSGDGEWKKELRRVRMAMEAWLEEEGERKGLRACIRRAEGLANARRK
jgi:checkpoint serine/threonine-protein kinase